MWPPGPCGGHARHGLSASGLSLKSGLAAGLMLRPFSPGLARGPNHCPLPVHIGKTKLLVAESEPDVPFPIQDLAGQFQADIRRERLRRQQAATPCADLYSRGDRGVRHRQARAPVRSVIGGIGRIGLSARPSDHGLGSSTSTNDPGGGSRDQIRHGTIDVTSDCKTCPPSRLRRVKAQHGTVATGGSRLRRPAAEIRGVLSWAGRPDPGWKKDVGSDFSNQKFVFAHVTGSGQWFWARGASRAKRAQHKPAASPDFRLSPLATTRAGRGLRTGRAGHMYIYEVRPIPGACWPPPNPFNSRE